MGQDGSFDRALEQRLLARLRAGQDATDLLAELRTRLSEVDAEALLTRAESRLQVMRSRQRPGRRGIAIRTLTGAAYLWAAMLLLPSVAIIQAANAIVESGGGSVTGVGYSAEVAIELRVLAVVKILLLLAAVIAHVRWRTLAATLFYGLVVLYAFPVGSIIEDGILHPLGPPLWSRLLNLSAIGSYLAVGFIALAYRLEREDAPKPANLATFD